MLIISICKCLDASNQDDIIKGQRSSQLHKIKLFLQKYNIICVCMCACACVCKLVVGFVSLFANVHIQDKLILIVPLSQAHQALKA